MNIRKLRLPGLIHIEPKTFSDDRGSFMEVWQAQRYKDRGIDLPFVQDNMSWSRKNVLRGLHFQNPHAQGKLVYVLVGEVFDVAVDIRRGSPTFGQWEGVMLTEETRNQLYIPPGFAHGFVVTSDQALFCYKCTDFYSPQTDVGVRWDDPTIAVDWPTHAPIVSPKDQGLGYLKDLPDRVFTDYRS